LLLLAEAEPAALLLEGIAAEDDACEADALGAFSGPRAFAVLVAAAVALIGGSGAKLVVSNTRRVLLREVSPQKAIRRQKKGDRECGHERLRSVNISHLRAISGHTT
jgi:hypothetical protein